MLLATFVVNTTADTPDADPGDGAAVDINGDTSLRAAIEEANALANAGGPDRVHFNIPGAGPHTIEPTSALPGITDVLVLDGYTQNGASPNQNTITRRINALIKIQLAGRLAGLNADGLRLLGGASTVQGLAIFGFSGHGIDVRSNGHQITGNFIGTSAAGTAGPGNLTGIHVADASDVVIGGLVPVTRNLISANDTAGVVLTNTTVRASIQGNFIGADITGTARLPNGDNGLDVHGTDHLIGSTFNTGRNVISGNGGGGVTLRSTNPNQTRVHGNFIGTDLTGSFAVANGGAGVSIPGSNQTIGGTDPSMVNVISGNIAAGIQITGAANHVVGNFIGINVGAAVALANGKDGSSAGVFVNGAGNTIGGDTGASGNVISGNLNAGIEIAQPNNVVQANFIGLDVTATVALSNGGPGIVLSSSASDTAIGAAGVGNVISGNGGAGIRIVSGDRASILNNLIGTDRTGTAALGNAGDGVRIEGGADHRVGGTQGSDINVIAGNDLDGVHVFSGGLNTRIEGNLIGTDITGSVALGNGGAGVRIRASQIAIGGDAQGAGNVISGNGDAGVLLVGSAGAPADSNRIQGNVIGTNVNVSSAIANARGIEVRISNDNLIGGASAGARNLISGNANEGILLFGTSSNNRVQGNFIGTDGSGASALGNGDDGIRVSVFTADNTIGGTQPNEGNLISGNGGDGVEIDQSVRTVVQGNRIGADISGAAPLGNDHGIHIRFASDSLIGGTELAARNTIAFNRGAGVAVAAVSAPATNRGHSIIGNTIVSNDGLGIDLSGSAGLASDGVTANDDGPPSDSDAGPNRLQNFPVLTAAVNGAGRFLVRGTLNSTPNTTFSIEFFANTQVDPSGHGEGETVVETVEVQTDDDGTSTFLASLPGLAVPVGDFITATATDPEGSTSEFSAAVAVVDPAIGVQGDGVPIDNGDTTPDAADQTDFGVAGNENPTTSRTFTILNSGTTALTLTGGTPVQIAGPHGLDFSVVSQPDTIVPAGGQTSFTIEFNPSNIGPRDATVAISHDDLEQEPFAFALRGNGFFRPLIGTVGEGQDARTALFRDNDNNIFAIKLSGPGVASVFLVVGGLLSVDLQGTNHQSVLRIAHVSGAEPVLESIQVFAAGMARILAPGVHFVGDIIVEGPLAKLVGGDVLNGARIVLGGTPQDKPTKVLLLNLEDAQFSSGAPVGKFKALSWGDTDVSQNPDTLSAPSIVKLDIEGAFAAAVVLSGSGAGSFTLVKVDIEGDLGSGDAANPALWDITGDIKKFDAANGVAEGFQLRLRSTVRVMKLGIVRQAIVVVGDDDTRGDVRKLMAAQWDVGVLLAGAIRKLVIKPRNGLGNGDFNANVELSGSLNPSVNVALGTATIFGQMKGAFLNILNGHAGKITVGRMVDSRIRLGVGALDVDVLPDDAEQFVTRPLILRNIKVVGIPGATGPDFVNSIVTAWLITQASLNMVQTANAGTVFGLAADFIGSVKGLTENGVAFGPFRFLHFALQVAFLDLGDFKLSLVEAVP